MGVQEVRREGVFTVPAEECLLVCGKRNENHELRTGFFVQERIVSVRKSAENIALNAKKSLASCHCSEPSRQNRE
jgi:hypothetical protein